jgi:hypothetical protein
MMPAVARRRCLRIFQARVIVNSAPDLVDKEARMSTKRYQSIGKRPRPHTVRTLDEAVEVIAARRGRSVKKSVKPQQHGDAAAAAIVPRLKCLEEEV